MSNDDEPERRNAVALHEQYGAEVLVYHEHPTWGPLRGTCSRCGEAVYRHPHGTMCPECIRETPGTDECHICRDSGERICGYHATCLWYCPDCGHIRRIGNRPVRPGSDVTVSCSVVYHPNRAPFDLPPMVRLCYESVAPPALREYQRKRSEAWNDATRQWHRERVGGGMCGD